MEEDCGILAAIHLPLVPIADLQTIMETGVP
jgi:hypothetical protein